MLQRGETVHQIVRQVKSLNSKHRTLSDPPTKREHLNDAIVNRTKLNTGKKVMQLAKLQQPEAGMDLKGASASSVFVDMSNVQRTKKNGGGTKKDSNIVSNHMSFNVIAPGGAESMRAAAAALQEAADAYDDNNHHLSPIKVSEHISLIVNKAQFDTHESRNTRKKARASTGEESRDKLAKTNKVRTTTRKKY